MPSCHRTNSVKTLKETTVTTDVKNHQHNNHICQKNTNYYGIFANHPSALLSFKPMGLNDNKHHSILSATFCYNNNINMHGELPVKIINKTYRFAFSALTLLVSIRPVKIE